MQVQQILLLLAARLIAKFWLWQEEVAGAAFLVAAVQVDILLRQQTSTQEQ
jgi:hypothetical protein